MIIRHTRASCDADHVNVVLVSLADTPDRTAYITGQSSESPFSKMFQAASCLASAGADIIAMPCNTAHYFYDALEEQCRVPFINIIDSTVSFASAFGAKKIGVLATDGTVQSQSYLKYCRKYGIECVVPSEKRQKDIMEIIYGSLKRAEKPDMDLFYNAAGELAEKGCDRIVLGCTELSLLDLSGADASLSFIDSLGVLAYKSIVVCGKTPCGFPREFDAARKLLCF